MWVLNRSCQSRVAVMRRNCVVLEAQQGMSVEFCNNSDAVAEIKLRNVETGVKLQAIGHWLIAMLLGASIMCAFQDR